MYGSIRDAQSAEVWIYMHKNVLLLSFLRPRRFYNCMTNTASHPGKVKSLRSAVQCCDLRIYVSYEIVVIVWYDVGLWFCLLLVLKAVLQ